MKKRLLAGLLVVCMLLAALPMTVLAAGGFSDVSSSDWFADEVAYVSAHGLMNGVGGDKFGPNLYITRGMLVTILYRMAGSPYASTYTGFTDVDSGVYYAQPISWAVRYGIVTGYGNGKFGPNDNITREQLAAILYRYADHMGENVDAGGSIRYFEDYRTISDYAYMPMIWAVERGLIGGSNGKLMPQAFATRAQVAAIIYRYLTEEPVLGGGLLGGMVQNATHKHSYATTWSNNETHHWHAADCGHDLKADEALHVYGSDYSCTVADECDVCGYKKAAGAHTYGDWTTSSGRHTRVCSSCGDIETAECTYPNDYTTDADQHWKVCDVCGVAGTKENHDFEWKVDTSATTTTTGVKHEECAICGLKRSENTEIPVLPHEHVLNHTAEIPATCEDEGTKEYWTCGHEDGKCSGKKYGDKDGNLVVSDEDLKIEALGHDWGAWTYDSNDTHKRSCSRKSACQVPDQTAPCTGTWEDLNDTNHQRLCTDCGNGATEAHTYSGDGVRDYAALTTTWTCTVASCAHEKVETGVAYIENGAIYDSISAAITAATTGDTVVAPLKAQEYALNTESLDFQSKAITVQIEGVSGTILNVGHPANGENAALGVYSTVSGSKLIVKNVSITGSETAKPNDGTRGIGISGNNNSGLVVEIDSCAFANLHSGIYLGGVTKATITNSTFTGCNAGIGGSDHITDMLTVTGCTFTDCPETIGWAGAEAAKLVIEESTISDFICWHNGELKVDVTNGAGEWTGKTCHEVVYIYTAEQLRAFANDVNANGKNFAGKTVMLMDDIDLNNEPWTPIGQTGATQFAGTFDGQGHTISKLNIDSSSQTGENYASGLFGWIERHDTQPTLAVKALNINGATVTGNHYVGVVVGYLSGAVQDCNVSNAVVSCNHANKDACGDKAGGIAGFINAGTITSCSVSDTTITAGRDAGGIVSNLYEGVTVTDNSVDGVRIIIDKVSTGCDHDGLNGGTIIGRVMGGSIDDSNTATDSAVKYILADGFAQNPVDNTYEISNATGLMHFASSVNDGKTYQNATIKITADIDLTGKNWVPINAWSGILNGSTIDGAKAGGGCYSIKNMRVEDVSIGGFISANASRLTIQNLIFDGAYVATPAFSTGNYSTTYAGVVIGKEYSGSTLKNITVRNSEVHSAWQCGGMVGFAETNAPIFDTCTISNSKIGGYNATAGTLFGLGIVNISLTNCVSENIQLYTDGMTWDATQKLGGDYLMVGHLYSGIMTATGCTTTNVTVVSAFSE